MHGTGHAPKRALAQRRIAECEPRHISGKLQARCNALQPCLHRRALVAMPRGVLDTFRYRTCVSRVLSVACCLLRVVCCVLHVVCCNVACGVSHVVCCVLSVACRLLQCCVLHVACCNVVCCMSSVAMLRAVRCMSPVACRRLRVVHCMLRLACCLLHVCVVGYRAHGACAESDRDRVAGAAGLLHLSNYR